ATAASARRNARSARSAPASSASAAATAHSSAADELRPAPSGTHESIAMSAPDGTAAPAGIPVTEPGPEPGSVARPSPATPGAVRGQQRVDDAGHIGGPRGRGPVVAAGAGNGGGGGMLGRDRTEHRIVAGAHGGEGAVADRHRQAQPAVVVGVLADQVDPAGR